MSEGITSERLKRRSVPTVHLYTVYLIREVTLNNLEYQVSRIFVTRI